MKPDINKILRVLSDILSDKYNCKVRIKCFVKNVCTLMSVQSREADALLS